jgi:hypothetical protein
VESAARAASESGPRAAAITLHRVVSNDND